MDIFICQTVGIVPGNTTVVQQADGTWLASCPIGNVFGEEVEGDHTAVGDTQENALLALEKELKAFDDFMWL